MQCLVDERKTQPIALVEADGKAMAPLGAAPALEAAIGVGTLRTYSSVTVHSARGQGPPRENALQATWVECPLSGQKRTFEPASLR